MLQSWGINRRQSFRRGRCRRIEKRISTLPIHQQVSKKHALIVMTNTEVMNTFIYHYCFLKSKNFVKLMDDIFFYVLYVLTIKNSSN